MLAKLEKAELTRSSEERVSRAIWFLFHDKLYYKITSSHFYLLAIDKRAVTHIGHKKKGRGPVFLSAGM